MENQSHHHNILSDHELEVDGVIYRELKSLNLVVIQDGPDAGKEEQVLVHTRSIGDKNYTVKKINSEGSENEETEKLVEENNMTRLEVEAFQEEWTKNWNPNLDQQERGIKGFLKKLLKYE